MVIRGAPPSEPPEGKRKKPHSFAAGADISEFSGKNSDDVRPIEVFEVEDSEMRRSRGRPSTSPMMPLPPLPVMIPPPSLPAVTTSQGNSQSSNDKEVKIDSPTLPEGANIAMKYVAKGDAVSDEEEEIEGFIAQRRGIVLP